MKIELKKAIIEYMFDTHNDFHLHNNTIGQFHAYIYDQHGEYLIGGKEVSDFIAKAVKLIKE